MACCSSPRTRPASAPARPCTCTEALAPRACESAGATTRWPGTAPLTRLQHGYVLLARLHHRRVSGSQPGAGLESHDLRDAVGEEGDLLRTQALVLSHPGCSKGFDLNLARAL